MSQFVLRDCQKPLVDLMTRMPRGNLFASPGTGKTSATLMAISTMSLYEDVFPVLVVAPLRVANMVWGSECEQWDQFRHMKVAEITGPLAKRRAALKNRADIYTINYENLAWLHEELDGKWPFRMVVADESTKLKNHRVHFSRHHKTGKIYQVVDNHSKNAAALVRHAKETPFWYNLTGTPAANGLTDLWAQQWPIDFGRALGNSFTAFKQRWFRVRFGSDPRHNILEPLDHAQSEITERLRATTAVVDAYDYFDVKKAVELDVMVNLPANVRKQYDRIHNDSILELTKMDTVTAVNMGSAVMKCRQIASGCVKDDDGKWHTLHTEKLAAVDEIREKIGNENLVIAYWFQHDLQALQQHIPDAVALPSGANQRRIVDDWNSGKIPVLLVHAQSAGHGLSLQHGGRHLVIYTQDWNAEYYAQVIDRLGPIRQAQSGYDRLVYIHRIIAKNTWEELVAKRQQGKLTLDQAVKRAVGMTQHEGL